MSTEKVSSGRDIYSRVLRTHQKIEMRCLSYSRSFFSDSLSLPSRMIPLPGQRLSIFSVFRKAVHANAQLFLLARAPRSRKSTASVQGEGKRAWRARVRAAATYDNSRVLKNPGNPKMVISKLSTPCVKTGFVLSNRQHR